MLTLLLLLGGCQGSGIDWVDTFDPNRVKDPTDTDITDPYVPPPVEDCIWAGSYEIVSAKCGEAGYSDWNAVYDTTSLVIEHNQDEGCTILFTLSNELCTEEVTFWADPEPEDTQLELKDNPSDDVGYGVTECQPAECKFTNSDGACKLGDHSSPKVVPVNQSTEGVLVFTFFAEYAAPTCEDGLRLTFQKL